MRYQYSTRWVRSGLSEKDGRFIDLAALCTNIQSACDKLAAEGYEIMSIMPIQRGVWDTHAYVPPGHAMNKAHTAFGFSVTEGAILVGRRPAA
jgi:hypothetical protein